LNSQGNHPQIPYARGQFGMFNCQGEGFRLKESGHEILLFSTVRDTSLISITSSMTTTIPNVARFSSYPRVPPRSISVISIKDLLLVREAPVCEYSAGRRGCHPAASLDSLTSPHRVPFLLRGFVLFSVIEKEQLALGGNSLNPSRAFMTRPVKRTRRVLTMPPDCQRRQQR
jgi:hypothetical protein